MGLFSGVQRVIAGLKRMAADANVPTRTVVLTEDKRHAGVPALAELNLLLADPTYTPDCTVDPADPAIVCYAAASRQAEAKAVAAAIAVRARAGVPYSRMAVICRDTAGYLGALRYEFRLQGIPLFCDEATTPENTAPARAVHAALDRPAAVSPAAVCCVCSRPASSTCRNSSSAHWKTMLTPGRCAPPIGVSPSPAALPGTRAPIKSRNRQTLADAEAARAFVMERVADFLPRTKNIGAAALTKQLYLFLQALGGRGHPQRPGRNVACPGPPARSGRSAAGVERGHGPAEPVGPAAGDEVLAPADYAELFTLLLRTTDMGHIPQSLDSVILTTAGRMRLPETNAVFVVGLLEGEFPQTPGDQGLLTHADRDLMIHQGAELPDCFENKVLREGHLLLQRPSRCRSGSFGSAGPVPPMPRILTPPAPHWPRC